MVTACTSLVNIVCARKYMYKRPDYCLYQKLLYVQV